MAANTWSSLASTDANTAGNWSAGWVPKDGDTMTMDATSVVDCILSGDIATANGVDGISIANAYTGTLNLNSNNLDSDGNVSIGTGATLTSDGTLAILYCAGDFTKVSGGNAITSDVQILMNGTGTLTCNGVSGGTLVNNSAGTITVGDAQLWSSWTNTLGTYTGGAFAHTIVGDIVRTAGTCTTATGAWTQTGTGALKWASTTTGQYPADLQANGSGTITDTYFATKKLSGNGTVTGAGTGYLYIVTIAAADIWSFTGTCACPVSILTTATTASTTAALTLQGKDLTVVRASGTGGLVVGAAVNLKGAAATAGSLLISATSGTVTTFDMVNYGLTANNVTLGRTNNVAFDFGTGSHNIAGAIAAGAVGAGTIALNFGSSKIVLGTGGTIDGSNITATSDAAIVNPMVSVVGGTVQDVIYEAGKTLNCSGGYTKDGGGNTTGEFWFGSCAERWHPAAIRERSWGFMAGTRR